MTTRPVDIDWDSLAERARSAAKRAYVPYSAFQVGAAAVVDDGRYIDGCNVENASYGLTLCAECSLVSDLYKTGGGRLLAVVVVAGDGQPVMPCGRCRQLIWEHGGPSCLINADGTVRSMSEILPGAFDVSSMEGRTRIED